VTTIDPDGFQAFWDAYPRKVGKGAARKLWARLKPTPEMQAQMHTALNQQRASDQWRDSNFVPHPTTWLSQERWQDQPAETVLEREDAQLVWVRLVRGMDDEHDGAYLRTLVTAEWDGDVLCVSGETPAAGVALARQWDVLTIRATNRGLIVKET